MYKKGLFKDLRVVWKEVKRLNMIDQWCIFLFRGNFEGMEIYDVEKWVKFITEGPDTVYFPINNPYIKGANKTEVPLEGK